MVGLLLWIVSGWIGGTLWLWDSLKPNAISPGFTVVLIAFDGAILGPGALLIGLIKLWNRIDNAKTEKDRP